MAEEVANYTDWLRELEAVPTIVSLRRKAEGIVGREMEKAANWLGLCPMMSARRWRRW